jgi:hypothetical protein
MRYTFENGEPKPIRYHITEGKIISNPPDELLDELGVGLILEELPLPEYSPDIQQAVKQFTVEARKIIQGWQILDIPQPDPPQPTEAELRLAQLELAVAELGLAMPDTARIDTLELALAELGTLATGGEVSG